MTRLIDADSIPWDVEGVGEIPVITKEEIDQMPTVDAVPVRHGKWEKTSCKWVTYECSECGEKTDETIMGLPRYVYCPMCGARMDEE